MFSRAARVSPFLIPCRRNIYQHRATLATAAAADAQTPVPPSIKRTALFRTWRIPANLTELYNAIREVEKTYGKIASYHLLKDFEDPTRYQLLSYIVFEDPASLQRIPETGIEMAVAVNPTPKLYYDIGIDDVESTLFNSAPPSESNAPVDENGAPMFGFKLMRSPMEYKSDRFPRGIIYQTTAYRSMEHFQNWAGFAKLDPLNPPRTIVEQELFANRTEIDQNRMRAALQFCGRHFIPRKLPVQKQPSTEQSASNEADSTAQNTSNETASTVQNASNETTSTAQSASNETTNTSTTADASLETLAPVTKSTLSKTDNASSKKSSTPPRSAAQLAADKATTQAKKDIEGAKKESKGKASGEIKSAESSKQKLVIPTAAQMPSVSQRQKKTAKNPKPEIKAAKNPKGKSKPKKENSKPEPQPAVKSEPEPPQPKGTLAKIWSLFSGS